MGSILDGCARRDNSSGLKCASAGGFDSPDPAMSLFRKRHKDCRKEMPMTDPDDNDFVDGARDACYVALDQEVDDDEEEEDDD